MDGHANEQQTRKRGSRPGYVSDPSEVEWSCITAATRRRHCSDIPGSWRQVYIESLGARKGQGFRGQMTRKALAGGNESQDPTVNITLWTPKPIFMLLDVARRDKIICLPCTTLPQTVTSDLTGGWKSSESL